MMTDPRRALPSIDALLQDKQVALLTETYGHNLTVEALRKVLSAARREMVSADTSQLLAQHFIQQTKQYLADLIAPTLGPVINATGVIIHTNLGRAPLSEDAMQAVQSVAGSYSTLEFDLESGKRGKRSIHAEYLITELTGAEAALVVNNNAAATMLALAALAGPTSEYLSGRGVIVSRGQLVEIGGGFRMPDVMALSGARMVEVGTTNRTHLRDYEDAISEDTALLIRVHHSNYKVIGFTTEPHIDELVRLAHKHDLLFVDDLGSGALMDTTQFGLAYEPTIQASLDAGADLMMFSGDKLLGGPQAGILIGRKDVIDQLKRHPLARAVRPDKMCLAALGATLVHYLKGEELASIPVWQMISASSEDINRKALNWQNALRKSKLNCTTLAGQSTVGGGSLPGETLPTTLLVIETDSAESTAYRLRQADIPVITRIIDDRVVLDPRTVLPHQENNLLDTLKSLAEDEL